MSNPTANAVILVKTYPESAHSATSSLLAPTTKTSTSHICEKTWSGNPEENNVLSHFPIFICNGRLFHLLEKLLPLKEGTS